MIYVDELKKLFEQEDNHFSSEDILNIINNKMHIVDAVETDPGHWIATRKDTSIGSFNARKCSACGEVFLGKVENGGNYCPNCGVRMDEENNKDVIRKIPAGDTMSVVPVVRCKDCKHAPREKIIGDELYIVEPEYENRTKDCTCPYVCIDSSYTKVPNGDWFCNKGQRKECEYDD